MGVVKVVVVKNKRGVSMLEQPLYSLLTVFTLGFVFGIGPCTVTCLPFLGPVYLSASGNLKKSWQIVVPFSTGRMLSYTALGGLSAIAGTSITRIIQLPVVGWMLGVATIAVALMILHKSFHQKRHCGSKRKQVLEDNPLLPSGLFFMGVGMAATPCAPLATVLLTSASSGNALTGVLLGLTFGLGAIVMPLILYGWGMAYFGAQIRKRLFGWRNELERASALMLIFIGIITVFR